jgi:uncharacterized membrane protein YdbT with pleckstrin-like domain
MSPAKKKKTDIVDDGRTIADMNVDGMPWYKSEKMIKSKQKLLDLNLTKKERRAMIFGALFAYLPIYLIIVGAFTVVYLLFLLFAWLT